MYKITRNRQKQKKFPNFHGSPDPRFKRGRGETVFFDLFLFYAHTVLYCHVLLMCQSKRGSKSSAIAALFISLLTIGSIV
ncbi:MAG: hypothetical protein ACI8RD_014554 [Bacillariaceae sp.]|jgi:hypothetical protein